MTEADARLCEAIAAARQGWTAGERGRHNAHRATGGVELHELGARCECAAATFLGMRDQWELLAVVKRPEDLLGDVGHMQVRGTSPGRRLPLHRDDPPGVPFVLVYEHMGYHRAVGWCYGREGQQERYMVRSIRKPCFLVPAGTLRPMIDLYRIRDDFRLTEAELVRLNRMALSWAR